jgi:hypothetical protein
MYTHVTDGGQTPAALTVGGSSCQLLPVSQRQAASSSREWAGHSLPVVNKRHVRVTLNNRVGRGGKHGSGGRPQLPFTRWAAGTTAGTVQSDAVWRRRATSHARHPQHHGPLLPQQQVVSTTKRAAMRQPPRRRGII